MKDENKFFLKFSGVGISTLGVWCVLLPLLRPYVSSGFGEMALFAVVMGSLCLGFFAVACEAGK